VAKRDNPDRAEYLSVDGRAQASEKSHIGAQLIPVPPQLPRSCVFSALAKGSSLFYDDFVGSLGGNLDEDMGMGSVSIEDLRQHVRAICERRDISVYRCKRGRQAMALSEAEEITIPPIRSVLSYATAMHEIGHILGRHQTSRRVMVRERWAWNWARANALVWTPAMERQARNGLARYAPRAPRIDRRWHPFEWPKGGTL
jgi:hypothetical protein